MCLFLFNFYFLVVFELLDCWLLFDVFDVLFCVFVVILFGFKLFLCKWWIFLSVICLVFKL